MKSPRTIRILVLPSQVDSCLMSVDVLRATYGEFGYRRFLKHDTIPLDRRLWSQVEDPGKGVVGFVQQVTRGRRTSLEAPQIRSSKTSAMPTCLARVGVAMRVPR